MTETSGPSSEVVALHSPHRLGVILVGAGSGARLGAGLPKAFTELGQQTLLERSVQTVLSLDGPGHLVVVAPDAYATEALAVLEAQTQSTGAAWTTNVALGGTERHFSVMNGLEQMPEWVDVVLVHDVARPLTPTTLFADVAHAVRERQSAVIPVLPVVDTVKRVDESGVILETVDRTQLVISQTPQGFLKDELQTAYEQVRDEMTDDAAVAQAAGFTVTTIPGSLRAHKLTTQADVQLLQWMLESDSEQAS